jgi:tRNA(adenine34) deaminase
VLVRTRIRRVIVGCTDPVGGAAGSVVNLLQLPGFNHRCDIAAGVLQDECAAILKDFFRERRDARDKVDHL